MRVTDLTDGPAVLYCNGRELGVIRVAASHRARYRGLLGEDTIDVALLLLKTNAVHTVGMNFPIDVAFVSRRLRVVDITHMKPNRWSRNRLTARHTLETAEGRLSEWGIVRGAQVTIEPLRVPYSMWTVSFPRSSEKDPADIVESKQEKRYRCD